jgi:hypothetical protein
MPRRAAKRIGCTRRNVRDAEKAGGCIWQLSRRGCFHIINLKESLSIGVTLLCGGEIVKGHEDFDYINRIHHSVSIL